MEIGDKVLYIYNDPWGCRKELKGSIGTIIHIDPDSVEDDDGNIICSGYYKCNWKCKNSRNFEWWVPSRDVRLLKPSDLS
jgi:hypothetical protein